MDRVQIGSGFRKQPVWRLWLGIPLIYVPLLTTVPFMLLGVVLVRWHLRMIGATNVKTYWDFVPSWISHRYRNADHITFEGKISRWSIVRSRYFWIFNCKLYCPMSVALCAYSTYLVKVVENWWCPFAHDRKYTYADGAIDRSFWHQYPNELPKLHPDDRDNPIWNETSVGSDSQ
ncbi:MAG: hypothetical protein PVJ30_04095 [Thiohalocapsa sp.]|jgi:hypothetical protein